MSIEPVIQYWEISKILDMQIGVIFTIYDETFINHLEVYRSVGFIYQYWKLPNHCIAALSIPTPAIVSSFHLM
jgi:hypothetical protein